MNECSLQGSTQYLRTRSSVNLTVGLFVLRVFRRMLKNSVELDGISTNSPPAAGAGDDALMDLPERYLAFALNWSDEMALICFFLGDVLNPALLIARRPSKNFNRAISLCMNAEPAALNDL